MTQTATQETRTEKDTMGEMRVPVSALYGASTQRAVLNFPISGRPVPADVIHAYGYLKAACAKVNGSLGVLNKSRVAAIVDAAGEVAKGLHDPHFPVDIFQTGSGTSTNMNANEVIANLICLKNNAPIGSSKDADYLGGPDGTGVHPNDHVNAGQSSNDTFPTAMHIAATLAIRDRLLPALDSMAHRLEGLAAAWDDIVKIGRTHLQDATPIRVGQEFSGYARQMRLAQRRASDCLATLAELPIGGTAVGTGINTHPEFGAMVASELNTELNTKFKEAANHFEAQHAKDAFVETSGQLKVIAVSLSKIANDIRWLGSGPRCGLGELKLPSTQPGSSIMPGKVNPVICEMAIQVACQVIGNDAAVTMGGMGGVGSILDLNVAMPMMAANVLDSINLLAQAATVFTDRLLDGLEVDKERCGELIEGSLAMCTSLVPVIGYDASAALAKEAYAQGKTVRQVALEKGTLSAEQLSELLDPSSMTKAHA